MQTQKDEIRERILDSARIEFQQNGFEKASIRSMARIAYVSKSNIYNYYNSKELLFEAVTEGTIREIELGFIKLKEIYRGTIQPPYTITTQKQMMEKFMGFVFLHIEDFKLLLFKSHGTRLHSFKKTVTEKLSEIFRLWLDSEMPDKNIPEFFIFSVAGFYIDTIEKIIANNLAKEDIYNFADYFLKFIYGGWKTIFQDQ